MIKQGLLDKHGKPNEKTPANYLADSVAQMSVSTPTSAKSQFVLPSEGNEPAPTKRKVILIFFTHFIHMELDITNQITKYL